MKNFTKEMKEALRNYAYEHNFFCRDIDILDYNLDNSDDITAYNTAMHIFYKNVSSKKFFEITEN